MQRAKDTMRISADEVRQILDNGGDKSDLKAAKAMSQGEVERLADDEDGPLPEGWESTVKIGIPARKQAIHMRLDADVLAWFRADGSGYQTRINAVLRAFVQARQQAKSRKAGQK